MAATYIEWLKAAEDDLTVLQSIGDNPEITNMSAFHAQQAVEKSIKAYLEAKDLKIPKTHKIQTLIDLSGLDFGDDELIQLLDMLYIDSRYPGDLGLMPYGKPTLEDAKVLCDFAVRIYTEIKTIIGRDKR